MKAVAVAAHAILQSRPLVTRFVCFQDDDYKAAGATIVDKATCFKADIVLKVKPPSLQEADMLKERAR